MTSITCPAGHTTQQERERRMPVVLVGPERIRSVLRRPSLASLESSVFIWHRLTP
ncbi:hypothetical protein AB0M97_30350 [Streptomyces sp. NPDC051207]|uniref:hypothetical protein n=1 Tax=Streptomyces sp. NPDC051207 TaxID=3154641 RepID=UPI003432A1FB